MTKANKITETKLQPLTGERQNGESDSAVLCCNDWLRMGAGRSVVELIKKYQDLSNFHQGYEPPTLTESTIYTWSSRYRWMERAAEYDETWEQRKNAEREQVFNQELALDFERVRKLVRLATMLEGQIYERGIDGIMHNVWQPDRKSIGTFPVQEFVDIERFNSALISEYRATLDDLAKEVGGRKQRTEHTGADGGAIIIKTGMDTGDI